MNDFSSFWAFSISIFDFFDLIECWSIVYLLQFSWQRLMMFEMLRESFVMHYFAIFEAYFEIVFDFFIKFMNRSLILHSCMLYITDDSSLMIILIRSFASDWLSVIFSLHSLFFYWHVFWMWAFYQCKFSIIWRFFENWALFHLIKW
jgi:hypothetical protein